MLRKGGGGDQPGGGHQTLIVEDHPDTVQSMRDSAHRKGASGPETDSCFATSILPGQGTFSADGPTRQALTFG
jgi:hypothetical protein